MSRRRTSRLRLAVALAAVAVTLAGCGGSSGSEDPSGPDISDGASAEDIPPPETHGGNETGGGCPEDLLLNQAHEDRVPAEYGISMISDAVAVALPDDPTCVMAMEAEYGEATNFWVFWAPADEVRADTIKQIFRASGYAVSRDGMNFVGGAAHAEVNYYEPGTAWSGYFGGAGVLAIAGGFHGDPGVVASQLPPTSFTWESSCMLTLDEVNAAFPEFDFVSVEPPTESSVACAYASDNFESVVVSVRPYTATGINSWATGSTWTTPNATEGAFNECEALSAESETSEREPICTDVGGVQVVIPPSRFGANIFMEGDYKYSVSLLGIGVDDEVVDPLLKLAEILVTRVPTPD